MEFPFPYWLWLFPVTYIIHILEEAYAGQGFHRWIGRIVGRTMTRRVFFSLNAMFLVLMVMTVMSMNTNIQPLWVIPMLGTITFVNGLAHLIGSIVTRSYSPGLISGLMLWIPLGGMTLKTAMAVLPSSVWWPGIIAGILVSLVVVLLALSVSSK